jgi:branched-chain amino acid transport system substrate-binding protein
MRGALLLRLSSLSMAASLFVAACGGGGAQPTTAPAAPAPTKPAAAAPSPATAASPSAAAAASPSAKPAASPSAAVAPSPSAAAAAGSALSGTIRIVSSLPRTGSPKGQTDTIVNAFKMALTEHQNKAGGATLDYVDMDDATAARGSWDPAQEASNANKAGPDADVMVYLGTFNSGAAKVSIPILCPQNLVMISPANTYPGLTKDTPYNAPNEPGVYYPSGCKRNYTRVAATDDIQGAVGAVWAQQLGATKIYVLHDSDLYGQGIAEVFNATAKKLNLNVVGGPEGIDPAASDYRAVAQKIRGTGADLVYFGGITDHNAGKLWQDLRSTLGNDVKLMGPDGINEAAFVDAAGAAAENTYGTFPGVPASKLTSQKGQDWYRRYKQQFQGEPDPYAAYGYEAMNVAITGIEKANAKDRAKIRDAVFATKDYDGVLGKWSFTDTGDTTLTGMSGRQVKNGKWDDDSTVTLQAPQ